MKTYYYEKYRIRLDWKGKTDCDGKCIVWYCFYTGRYGSKDQVTIMEGEDLGASPLHDPESRQTAGALLAFASCAELVEDGNERHAQFVTEEAEGLYIWQERLERG